MPYQRVDELRNYAHLHNRPEPQDRLFTSEKIESVIKEVSEKIKDEELRRMFSQCLPNTLDTTVYYSENSDGSEPDTFVVTGDIPAMWLRDSTNQVWPYLRFVNDDEELKKLFTGMIRRQARSVVRDPYANAFGKDYGIFERKYELDSLAAFFRISAGYFEKTKDLTPFDGEWLGAVNKALEVIHLEQNTLHKDHQELLFHFKTHSGHLHPAIRMKGYGYPGKSSGLSRCVFRPSDDECVFPYLIPANAMTVVGLRKIQPILHEIAAAETANVADKLADTIQKGIEKWGIVEHPNFGKVYAYEVDGFGSSCIMDDPNVPSLLSLPYLGFCEASDTIYKNTRELVLGTWNPFYAVGDVASGITSPHVGVVDHFWPMATIMQALTSDDPGEIKQCLKTLKRTHGGTHFIHESVHVDDPHKYTRPWFAWANSLFGELILEVNEKFPDVLAEQIS